MNWKPWKVAFIAKKKTYFSWLLFFSFKVKLPVMKEMFSSTSRGCANHREYFLRNLYFTVRSATLITIFTVHIINYSKLSSRPVGARKVSLLLFAVTRLSVDNTPILKLKRHIFVKWEWLAEQLACSEKRYRGFHHISASSPLKVLQTLSLRLPLQLTQHLSQQYRVYERHIFTLQLNMKIYNK